MVIYKMRQPSFLYVEFLCIIPSVKTYLVTCKKFFKTKLIEVRFAKTQLVSYSVYIIWQISYQQADIMNKSLSLSLSLSLYEFHTLGHQPRVHHRLRINDKTTRLFYLPQIFYYQKKKFKLYHSIKRLPYIQSKNNNNNMPPYM